MTDTYELPELPPSQMYVEVWDSEVQGLHGANAAYYTDDQMKEYARLAVKAERERCAKVCEQEAAHMAVRSHSDFLAAERCAAAIRQVTPS